MSDELRTITAIRTHRRGSKLRTIALDGDPWRPLALEAVRELGLREGDAIDPAETEQRLSEVEPGLARERAYRLLAYRDRSVHELTTRLTEDGYSASVVVSTVASLTETGLVDDRRVAESLARSLVTLRGFGRARALREMTRRGVAEDLSLEALDELSPAEDEPARAVIEATRLYRSGDRPEKLAARLIRRGFTTASALDAGRQVVSEADPAHTCSDFGDGGPP